MGNLIVVTTDTRAGNFTPGVAAQALVHTNRAPMVGDLRGIVSRAVSTARATGRDYMAQSRAAAVAVTAVRPDLTLGQALDAVMRLRDLGDAA